MTSFKSTFLWSTTALGLTLVTMPAHAQATQPATPPDPTVQAQTNPADDSGAPQTDDAVQTAAGADQATGTGDVIVVTGLRRSLQSAQNIKKNSRQVVDAVVAEDIGKLPDVAVSDTAARIPGIQVERSGGEASRVLLRGLDRNYYTTTYNGREIFTAETRSVALQDFPAGGISAIEAFKTSTADLVEPGIAGLINVRSRRPFDFKGREVAGSVWGVYPSQSRDLAPNAQLLLSDRWHVGGGEIGALINFSYTKLHYQDSIRRHGFFVANLAGARSPDWPEIHYNEADRWRPSINGALQWRPDSGNMELYAEGLWQGFRENSTDRMWAQPLWSCGPGAATYSNIVTNSDNQIISGTVQNPGCPGETWGFQGATKRRTNTYQFAVGGRFDVTPDLTITADLARTSSKFNLRTESIDYELNTNQYTVNWYTGRPGGSGPTFQVSGIDPTDPSIYNYRGFFEDYLTAKGNDWQGRFDVNYEPKLTWLRSIQAGVRYVDRSADRTAGNFYWNNTLRNCCGGPHPLTPITSVPLVYGLFNSAFHGDSHKPFPTTWFAPKFDSLWADLRNFRQFNIDLLGYGSLDGPPTDRNRSFSVDEKSLAGYAQASFTFELGGEASIDGSLGIRGVRTTDDVTGTLFAPGHPPQPISVKNKYTDWLPNLNANIHFNRSMQLRLAATKTQTRPLFEQLNPALNLASPSGCSPAASNCVRTGNGGNPFLKPLKSNNYDASLEYYFSRTGFASIGAFQRDMKGFIVNQTFRYPTPDPETGLPLEITGPTNTNKGRIRGFEAQVSTFFDWDFVPTWARSFGIQANTTYIKADTDLKVAGIVRRTPIADVSKWTSNLVGMYERGPLTLRLAYNVRSHFPEGTIADDAGNGNGFTRQGRGNAVKRLDWSSSYAISDRLTVFFDWTNLLKQPYQSDIVWKNYSGGKVTSSEIFPMYVRDEESVISTGIRFRL